METNNLNNLPPFYVGQKVVYITGREMPKNSEHIVKGLKINCCGLWDINVGIKSKSYFINKNNGVTHIICKRCKQISEIESFYFGFLSTSFRPLNEQPFPSLTMQEVIKKESQLVSLN